MNRLLTTTAALSIALAPVNPWPVMAQSLTENGAVVADDGTVLCKPKKKKACNLADYVTGSAESSADEDAERAERKAAEAEAQAAAQAEAEAQRVAEEEQAARNAKREARKAAEAAAAEEQAAAEANVAAQEAAAQAEAEAQRAAEEEQAARNAAEAAAAEEAATESSVAEPEVAAQDDAETQNATEEEKAARKAKREARKAAEAAAAEEAAAVDNSAEPEVAAQDDAEAQSATEEEKAARKAKREARKAAEAAAAEAEAQKAADAGKAVETGQTDEPQAVLEEPAIELTPEGEAAEPVLGEGETPRVKKNKKQRAAEAAALKAAQSELAVDGSGALIDPSAGLKTEVVDIDPNAVPVKAPVVSSTEAETLTELLGAPDAANPGEPGAVVTLIPEAAKKGSSREPLDPLDQISEIPPTPGAVGSVTRVLGKGDIRSSREEFAAPPVIVAPGQKNGLSNLEKVGLLALGALVVGAIVKGANEREERQVVSNTGDRVVVLNPDGTYSVFKDDDTVLRSPGSTVRTETFNDGSTRTIVQRTDGSQVVTIRDATGRVLRRAAYDRQGREIVLLDDLSPEVPVIVAQLPSPRRDRVTISAKDEDAALKARLAAREAAKAGRTFSLRQIREIPEVRALAATIDVANVTFDSGSAAISASEAEYLADLGALIEELLDENPAEVFLVEGHTDATGKAAMNLALSDRRAESVALALTEYFDIPPENLVVQGYGEGELLIDTQADERENRRVVVRVITPLLSIAAN